MEYLKWREERAIKAIAKSGDMNRGSIEARFPKEVVHLVQEGYAKLACKDVHGFTLDPFDTYELTLKGEGYHEAKHRAFWRATVQTVLGVVLGFLLGYLPPWPH